MTMPSAILDGYLQQEKAYWRGKLGTNALHCGLPVDSRYSGSPAGDQEGVLEFTVPAVVSQRIIKAGRENQSLVFAILVSALKICLRKYCDVEDIVVGSAIHGRKNGAALPNRALLLRDRVEDTMTVRQLLDQVRHTLAEAYANQRYPLDNIRQLVGASQDEKLFGVAILLDSIHDPENVRGLEQDLTLIFTTAGEQLSAKLFYNAARLRAEICEQFIEVYQNVLKEMMSSPDNPIASVQLFSAEQKRLLLQRRNNSGRDYPRDSTIHRLFEEQARVTPDAVSVRYEDRCLTYRQLNEAANRLAHYLRKRGAGPEVAIGICLERSLEMIVGLLAILKSGAAYVPLDPEYPPERQQLIVAHSAVKLIVTRDRLLAQRLPGTKPVLLEEEAAEIDKESEHNLKIATNAGNLAYVMYTSGSTGSPKGVAVPHRGVVRLVTEANYVELGEQEKILQFAPLSFDASTFEIWGSLLNGGELIVMGAGKQSLDAISQTIRRRGITTLWLTAGLFQFMTDDCLEHLKGIRQLLAGGDVVPVAAAQKYLQANPQSTLIDGYGPTENTTFTCCYRITTETEIGNSVPIGMPVSNTDVHIVDSNFDLVPIGVTGELYTGGDGLVRGYVGRPDWTAEMFVPNPFSKGGTRLYRTGDLARYRWDGAIEFVGRADQQIKVRGFRIEPAEIENILGQHPSIQQTVVTFEESGDGQKQLCAYAVAEERLTRKELQMFLAEKLPDYMMPTALMIVREMPLTANGKVDREELARQRGVSRETEEDQNPYVAPRDETETAIASIWQDVLGLERVGVYDNFFEIGGHSLLAMRLCARMNERLPSKTRVTDLFVHPTIESLARQLSGTARIITPRAS